MASNATVSADALAHKLLSDWAMMALRGVHAPSYCYNNNSPDNNNLKILYYNTHSIFYKIIDELSTNCSLYCPDIVCITEM